MLTSVTPERLGLWKSPLSPGSPSSQGSSPSPASRDASAQSPAPPARSPTAAARSGLHLPPARLRARAPGGQGVRPGHRSRGFPAGRGGRRTAFQDGDDCQSPHSPGGEGRAGQGTAGMEPASLPRPRGSPARFLPPARTSFINSLSRLARPGGKG